jgi:hypothetical protein
MRCKTRPPSAPLAEAAVGFGKDWQLVTRFWPLVGSIVGWELRFHPSGIERIDLFARDRFAFVARFVFEVTPRLVPRLSAGRFKARSRVN